MTDGAHERIADGASGDVGAVAVARGGSDARIVAVNPPRNDVVSEQSAVISMIERAARDPAVDIDKLERLMGMRERMQAHAARISYDEAFAAMQPELPEIDKRGKIIIKEKGGERVIQSTPYALWDDTNRLIKPILAKFGFGLSFRIGQTDAKITTTAVLAHKAGHREETSFASGIDATGSKNNVQGWGSSFTYGKRYSGTAILNITTRGEDDDGKAASLGDVITDEQAATLREWIEATASDESVFLAHFKADSIAAFPAAKFAAAVAAFKKKAGRK